MTMSAFERLVLLVLANDSAFMELASPSSDGSSSVDV